MSESTPLDFDAAEWLHQEALDHFDTGVFGTYELVWLLRGSSFALTDEEARALARTVLAQVVEERGALVVPMKWRGRERLGDPADRLALDDTQLFEFGPEGEFYALMLPEDL